MEIVFRLKEIALREILTNDQMAMIILAKKGWVLNRRPESRKVHHATCEALSAMVIKEYPKYFSEDRAAARAWLNETFGTTGWKNCGYCSGLTSARD